MKRKKVVIFGGAFDPVHRAHYNVALNLIEGKPEIDELWFLPSYSDVFKKKSLSNPIDRVAMLKLLLDEYPSEKMRVCTYEIENKITSGTYKTMLDLQKEYPTIEFSLLLGADQAIKLYKWRNSRKLRREFNVYVHKRYGKGLPFWAAMAGHCIGFNNNASENISSSAIREFFAKRGPLRHNKLTNYVNEYIINHGLYMEKGIINKWK